MDSLYGRPEPILPLGLRFKPPAVSEHWFDWPSLSNLFSESFPGVHPGRDRLIVDMDSDRLRAQAANYFNPDLSPEEIAGRYPAAMKNSSAFKISDARNVRNAPHHAPPEAPEVLRCRCMALNLNLRPK